MNSIAGLTFQSAMTQVISGNNRSELPEKLQNFWQCLHTYSPAATDFVASNFGGPAERTIQRLNAADRMESVFECEMDDMVR